MRSHRVIVVKGDRFTRTLLVIIAALMFISYLRDIGIDVAKFGRVAIGLRVGPAWKTPALPVVVENRSFDVEVTNTSLDVEVTNTPTVELDEPVEVKIR